MEEHLMQHPHSFTKDKARDMANLVRERQSGKDPPSKTGKTFVSNQTDYDEVLTSGFIVFLPFKVVYDAVFYDLGLFRKKIIK
jgi:hypothetical protein